MFSWALNVASRSSNRKLLGHLFLRGDILKLHDFYQSFSGEIGNSLYIIRKHKLPFVLFSKGAHNAMEPMIV